MLISVSVNLMAFSWCYSLCHLNIMTRIAGMNKYYQFNGL